MHAGIPSSTNPPLDTLFSILPGENTRRSWNDIVRHRRVVNVDQNPRVCGAVCTGKAHARRALSSGSGNIDLIA